MGLLRTKLAQLEARLQSLVEGSAARLLPFRTEQDGLSTSLVAAMTAGIQTDAEGTTVAPNLFTLILHPDHAQVLRQDDSLLKDLAGMIHETGAEAGWYFRAPPIIRVSTDANIDPNQVRVLAEISPADLGQTSTVGFTPGEDPALIPPNAFLIVEGVQVVPLAKEVINLGRRPDNHLVIDDPRVSRAHAQLRAIKGRYVIFDLDSSGGTYVNGVRLQQATLYPGDVISLAGVSLVFGQETSMASDSVQGATQPMPPDPPLA